MQHLFVEYPLALKLKEAGFEEPCCSFHIEKELHIDGAFLIAPPTEWKGDVVAAPIYQQVFDWLDGKGFDIMSEWLTDSSRVQVDLYENGWERTCIVLLIGDMDKFAVRRKAWDGAIEEALLILKEEKREK